MAYSKYSKRKMKYKPQERTSAMNSFKTFVITKKTLYKALALIILAIFFVVILVKALLPNSTPVFSYNATEIIEKGTIKDDLKDAATGIAEDILGFDVTNPKEIMDVSSAGMENAPIPSPTISPTLEPQINNKVLPSKEEVASVTDIKLNNATDYDVNISELCNEQLDFKLDFTTPEVLIVHTHTTECYAGDAMSGENERTTNEAYNMCKIGDIIANTLKSHGIGTIHDKTIHDYPTYQTAYSKAIKTIQKNIDENPSIKVVLDIHRDAYIYPDGSRLKVNTDINGKSVAQVMLVLGTDSLGLEHTNWRSNLKFASKIQQAAQHLYPGLMRPINLRRERFNMHMTTGSLLLEIGSNGNSLSEAEISAEYIGNAIATTLING